MDIESLAISTIENEISKTDYLVSYIKSKDREPLWDGSIYVYSDVGLNHKNEAWIGKVPVQVKGKIVKDVRRIQTTYPISVSDLKKYGHDGGVLYFVVLIDPDGENKTIFCAKLLPYEINNYVNSASKKTVSVVMNVFPTEKNEIENLAFNFIRDSERQVLLRQGKNVSVEQLASEMDISKLKYGLSYTALGYEGTENNPFLYMSSHDTYIYAYEPNLNFYTVLSHLERVDECRREISCEVSIKGEIYYNNIFLIQKRDQLELHIGSCITVMGSSGGEGKFKFDIKGSLHERVLGIQFMIEMIKYGQLELDHEIIKLRKQELNRIDRDWLRHQYQYLHSVQEVFDILGVKDDLECDKLSKKEQQYINMLILAFVKGESIGFKEKINLQPVGTLKIGNIVIVLLFRAQADGKYKIENFFDYDLECMAEGQEGLFPTSQFTIMKADDFCNISNYNFEKARNALLAIENPVHYERVNCYLLELITAYDMSQREIFLNEAEIIAKWLCDKDNGDICKINLFQIYERKSILSEQCLDELIEMEERNKDNVEMALGIEILLKNNIKAKRNWNSLSDNQRSAFERFPIYKLWKGEKE